MKRNKRCWARVRRRSSSACSARRCGHAQSARAQGARVLATPFVVAEQHTDLCCGTRDSASLSTARTAGGASELAPAMTSAVPTGGPEDALPTSEMAGLDVKNINDGAQEDEDPEVGTADGQGRCVHTPNPKFDPTIRVCVRV